MLLVGSKIEAGSLIFPGNLARSRGRLCHKWRCHTLRGCICHESLDKAPAQHRPSILDDLFEIDESLNGAPWQQLLLDRLLHRAPHTYAGFQREPLECLKCGL